MLSHLDLFLENLGALSDEQGERFHQDISEIEERYQGRCGVVMLTGYCVNPNVNPIQRESVDTHRRKSLKRKFMPDT